MDAEQGGRLAPNETKAERVYQGVRARIEDGEFRVGNRLPSDANLGAQYGVSHATVARARQRLAHQGWLRRCGSGRASIVVDPQLRESHRGR